MSTEKEPKANAAVTDATTIMDELLHLIDRIVPVHSYMAAENTCTMNDIRERDRWGEDSDSVGDLRNVRRDVMDGIRELADDIARLARRVAATKAA